MRLRPLATALFFALTCGLTTAAPARAADEGAQGFVEHQHQKLSTLLHQPASAAREAQVNHELDAMVDYDELARRAFGQPCPHAIPQCTNYWEKMSDAERTEMRGLLKRLVEKNYKKNLEKTLDYEVTYKGAKDLAGDTKVRTEAKSKSKPRDPAVQVDYVVKGNGSDYHVVDIVTEGSSLTKNYYDQFEKKFKAHGGSIHDGFIEIRDKLNDKINKK